MSYVYAFLRAYVYEASYLYDTVRRVLVNLIAQRLEAHSETQSLSP